MLRGSVRIILSSVWCSSSDLGQTDVGDEYILPSVTHGRASIVFSRKLWGAPWGYIETGVCEEFRFFYIRTPRSPGRVGITCVVRHSRHLEGRGTVVGVNQGGKEGRKHRCVFDTPRRVNLFYSPASTDT